MGTYLLGALVALAACLPNAVKSDGGEAVYRVGLYQNAPKIFSDADGRAAGFFPAIIAELAKRAGFQAEYVNCEWAACLAALAAGDIHIMPDVAWSEERAAHFRFGREPVLTSFSYVYVRPGQQVSSLFDLDGEALAVLKDSVQHARLREMLVTNGPKPVLRLTTSHEQTLAQVESGLADAGVVNGFFGVSHEKNYRIARSPIVFGPATLFFAYGASVPKETITAMDLNLAMLKQNPRSLYFQAKTQWLEPEDVGHTLAGWVLPALAAVGLALAFSIAVNAYFQRRVGKATAELRQNESLLRSIFDNLPVGLLIKDAEHKVERPNPRYLEWYGLTPEEFIGFRSEEYEDFQPADDAQVMTDQERQVMETGATMVRRIERPFADGTPHILEITKFPIYDEDGKIAKVGSVSVDLTELLKAQEALRLSEKKYRAMFENAGVGMAMCRMDGSLTEVNQAFLDIIGYSEDEVFDLTYWDITPRDYEAREAEQLQSLRATGRYGPYEKHYLHKDGHRVPVLLNGSLVRVGDEEQIWSVVEDVSERRRAAEMVENALAEAERANQAKSEFLATMSHEFRTPLNAILGFSEMLRSQYLGPIGNGSYREYAEDIHVSGQHMLALVNDVLDIAAIEAGKRELDVRPLDMADIVRTCIRTFEKPAADSGIVLTVEMPPEPPEMRGDHRSVVQIIQNLLSNAIKFTEPGGRITLSVLPGEDELTVRVIDTGIGIPADLLPDVVEPFSQSRDNPHLTEEGTGLGLAIVKSLVEAHGGSLDIESEMGVGTSVTVHFPVMRAAAE